MKKSVIFLWLVFPLFWAFSANAGVSLSAYADRQSAASGDTVNIAAFVEVGRGDAFTGGSVYLHLPTAGSVTLTGVDYSGGVVFTSYDPPQPPLSDFNDSYDLGGDVQDINSALHEGRYWLGTYSLLIERYVPILRIELSGGDGYFKDAGFISYPYSHADGTEIIERSESGVVPSVPEPTILLGLVGVGMMRRRRA